MADDTPRCKRCGWPLAAAPKDGCVEGNCSCRCPSYPGCSCGAADGKARAVTVPTTVYEIIR